MDKTAEVLKMLLVIEKIDPWAFNLTCEMIRLFHKNTRKGVNDGSVY